MPVSVMLVDDHILFLEGLQYTLETYGVNVIGTAQSAMEAITKARALKPNIILMDIRMPEIDGIEALKRIKAEVPDIKVVMLTTSEEDEDLIEAIRSGASGYLLKSITAKALFGTLSAIERGEVSYNGVDADRYFQDVGEKTDEGPLTARQKEILTMVVKGVTYKGAGEALGLTERTVKYHMERIIAALGFENRAQVISYAARTGFLERK